MPEATKRRGKVKPIMRITKPVSILCSLVAACAFVWIVSPRETEATVEPAVEQQFPERIHENVLYRDEEDVTAYMREQCRLDVSYPADAEGFPAVVWFHGGGLTGGERSIPEPLRHRGIAIVTADYRLSPKVQSPAYVEDAAAAVAWCIEHIAEYGGDPDQVYVSGHSAGGYLTSMVGFDKHWLAAHDIDADSLAGLIPLSGHTITHFTVRAEQGIPGTQVVVDEMAPLNHVRPDAPPTLLITGDREFEMLGRYEENAYFWRMLKVVGDEDVELYELEGLNHGSMLDPACELLVQFVKQHAGMD